MTAIRKHTSWKPLVFIMILALAAGSYAAPAKKVRAENFLFVTDISLAFGTEGLESLEDRGYSVMSMGLNYAAEEEKQVWLGYKVNEGEPVTDVIIRPESGDAIEVNGMHYVCAGHVDVEQGQGAGGVVYFTRDKKAGAALVALDILRADASAGEELLSIPNDGSELVRNADNAPADLEPSNANITMHLAMIRDGLTKPYIREFTFITARDLRDAVYTAACWGYNYYIEGDIDTDPATYTVIAYDRTADPDEAVTNIVAVTAELAEQLEKNQIRASVNGGRLLKKLSKDGLDDDSSEEGNSLEESSESEEDTTESAEMTEPQEETGEESTETGEESTETEEEPSETEEDSTETEEDSTETEEESFETEEESSESEEDITESEEEDTTQEPDLPDLSADTLDIGGYEYVRLSSRTVPGETPYYLYITRDPEAGNPISMLYSKAEAESTEVLFGTWAYGYFSEQGLSRAYSYIVNEDLFASFPTDKRVCVRVPLVLVGGTVTEEGSIEETEFYLSIAMLTEKEGLPAGRTVLRGLRERSETAPVLDRSDRTDGDGEFLSTAFTQAQLITFIIVGVVLLSAGAAAFILIRKRRKSS